jgi:trimethylamine:corrinoid methyltransferase-like protein
MEILSKVGVAFGAPEALALFRREGFRIDGKTVYLTDAHVADAQAAGESALALSTAVCSGIDFILDAAGILGAYMAMSFEKFLIDERLKRP